MIIRPNLIPAPNVKVMINIGAGFDIPTGTYLECSHGEHVLNGGLGIATAFVGKGNAFKSTLMHYGVISASARIACAPGIDAAGGTNIGTYDTEVNVHEIRCLQLTQRFPIFAKTNILENGMWSITDKTVYSGNKWHEEIKTYLNLKVVNAKKLELPTPFMNRSKEPLKIIVPSFGELDSLTEFQTDDVLTMINANELGDSGGNTMFMREGLAKAKFLREIPNLSSSAYHYISMTAHIGKDIAMATGPGNAPPPKKLQHLKNGDTIKGATDKFTFLMSNCWHAYNAAPLSNQGTKGPEYPRNPDDNNPYDPDLNVVLCRQLRSKSGQSGIVLEVVVSQSEGVLAELTEFHYIKGQDRFGISGSLQHYNLDLYPEVKLSRTTVRNKIDNDPVLCRALNITSELCQMHQYWHHMDDGTLCTAKELYDDLKALGYDWNILLNTRGWWTLNNDKHPIPFLSTMDLLLMRKGKYFPYWMNEDKTVKEIKGGK